MTRTLMLNVRVGRRWNDTEGKNLIFGEKPVSVPLWIPQTARGMTRNLTLISWMKGGEEASKPWRALRNPKDRRRKL
jgi:hypothetical protein